MLKQVQFFLVLVGAVICSCKQHGQLELNYEKQFTLVPPTYSGVEFKNPIEETKSQNHLVNDMLISGAGVAVGDINNDGLPDLYFTGNQVQDRLYLNKGNLKFEDITEVSGILPENIWSSGVTMADINNDGHIDIYVCKYVQGKEQLSENLLYINNGNLTFSERAAEFGLADRGFAVQANFFDLDKDGNLDVYIVNQPPSEGNRKGNKITLSRFKSQLYTDKIFKNMGDGKFYDISPYCGINNLAMGLSVTSGDLNNDRWQDLYVANDYEKPDHLYMNQGNSKFNNTVNQSLKHMSNFSMGVDIADYDNDGFLDIIVVDMVSEDHERIKTNMGGMNPEVFWDLVKQGYHYQYMFNTLQKNNGNGTFSEVGQLAGVSNTDWSWSALFADFDNDGWKDLFITNGVKRAMRNSDLDKRYGEMFDSLENVAQKTGKKMDEVMDIMEFVNMSPTEKLNNYIFKNNGDLTFTKKIQDWGFDLPTLSYGSAYADLDLDGDLDLIVNNTDDYAHIYRNNSVEKGQGNYLEFRVKNKFSSSAYGARVNLYKNGEFWQMSELTNVRGYKSKSDDIIHFGLGKTKNVEKIEIIWPSGKIKILKNVKSNQLIEVNHNNVNEIAQIKKEEKLFKEVTGSLGIKYFHEENSYDDYAKEVLLPHKMSNFGPCISIGDVNGDKLEDFYVGGSSGNAGTLYLQNKNETFDVSEQRVFESDKLFEDLDSELLDFDSDGDLDLYVVSGGNEFEPDSDLLIDRLYINDGKGNFKLSVNILPIIKSSGSKVKAADFDNDDDLDLFIGGRMIPGKYPFPANSYILRNENGKYEDVTDEIAPELKEIGLVTDVSWTDFDGDKQLDLIVVGEWMPVTFFKNISGKFQNATHEVGLENTTGWYYGILSEDFDNDGDMDFVTGNLGLNYKYKASLEEPFEVYSGDLDGNGTNDIVLGYHEHGNIYPVRGKSCSTEQAPMLATKFPTYKEFATSDIEGIYGDALKSALHYKAFTFASYYLENMGDGTFNAKVLPNEAQFSSINNIISRDFDKDGNLDIVMSGNLYPAEIETARNDAGMGLYLKGDGSGNFNPISLTKSGFFAPHDAKDMKIIRLGTDNSKEVILVANNQYWMQAIGVNEEYFKNDDNSISLK